jgi:hypothetical protein
MPRLRRWISRIFAALFGLVFLVLWRVLSTNRLGEAVIPVNCLDGSGRR